MNLSKENLLSKADQLVSVPQIVFKLNNLINDPNSNIEQFGKLIETDPAISIKLLRIVNSSYYNMRSEVDSISRAIAIVGTKDLNTLVMAASMVNAFKAINNSIISLDNFWRHSINCGIHARVLARHCKQSNIEMFFTTGLLHDIGSLVLYQFAPDESENILTQARSSETNLGELERNVFGFSSAEIGADLARLWQLPANLEQAIRFHNAPDEAEQISKEIIITHIANHLANISDIISNRLQKMNPISTHYWEYLDLNPDVLQTSHEQIQEQFNEMTNILISDNLAA